MNLALLETIEHFNREMLGPQTSGSMFHGCICLFPHGPGRSVHGRHLGRTRSLQTGIPERTSGMVQSGTGPAGSRRHARRARTHQQPVPLSLGSRIRSRGRHGGSARSHCRHGQPAIPPGQNEIYGGQRQLRLGRTPCPDTPFHHSGGRRAHRLQKPRLYRL